MEYNLSVARLAVMGNTLIVIFDHKNYQYYVNKNIEYLVLNLKFTIDWGDI